jgi:hypothetical protein
MPGSVRIAAAVGIRSGKAVMPNLHIDLVAISELFDQIPFALGGTREIGGLWATERSALIAEVTAEILRFQAVNRRPVVDGVIDPGGGTLKRMNELAIDDHGDSLRALVVRAPEGMPEDMRTSTAIVVDVTSVSGIGPMRSTRQAAPYFRRLVRVTGSSIKWFGVVIPTSGAGAEAGTVPHLNFTPTPIQGGYQDSSYEAFGGWAQLWEDYTSMIGGQLAASGANQILIIPIYRTSQQRDLGDFFTNWKEVVSAVITVAKADVDPSYAGNTFVFRRIVSSSFSNGWVAHQAFHTRAVGAAAMTDVLFDLDGVAGGSNWQPPMGIIYQNRAPIRGNPVGNLWYVGGRWADFKQYYGGNMNTHATCRNHLLYHGLWLKCT